MPINLVLGWVAAFIASERSFARHIVPAAISTFRVLKGFAALGGPVLVDFAPVWYNTHCLAPVHQSLLVRRTVCHRVAQRVTHRMNGLLTSCAFGDYQGDVVGLFMRAESSSLICNCCQQLRQGLLTMLPGGFQ